MTAMLTAMVFAATTFFKVPVGLGYIHFGDVFVILAALMLPRRQACFAGGAGAALADVIGGFAVWAPWTVLIKVGTALLVSQAQAMVRKSGQTNDAPATTQSSVSVPAQASSAAQTQPPVATQAQASAQPRADVPRTAGGFRADVPRTAGGLRAGVPRTAGGFRAGAIRAAFYTLAAVWTAAGYYLAEGVIYGNWVVPLAGIPFNILQIALGAVAAHFLFHVYARLGSGS